MCKHRREVWLFPTHFLRPYNTYLMVFLKKLLSRSRSTLGPKNTLGGISGNDHPAFRQTWMQPWIRRSASLRLSSQSMPLQRPGCEPQSPCAEHTESRYTATTNTEINTSTSITTRSHSKTSTGQPSQSSKAQNEEQ